MSAIKKEFTDERIGGLLADVVKWKLNSNTTSFKQDGDYQCRINFTVADEHIVIGENDIFKLRARPDNSAQVVLSKIEADIICNEIMQNFYDSDIIEHHGINLARNVIESFVVKKAGDVV